MVKAVGFNELGGSDVLHLMPDYDLPDKLPDEASAKPGMHMRYQTCFCQLSRVQSSHFSSRIILTLRGFASKLFLTQITIKVHSTSVNVIDTKIRNKQWAPMYGTQLPKASPSDVQSSPHLLS